MDNRRAKYNLFPSVLSMLECKRWNKLFSVTERHNLIGDGWSNSEYVIGLLIFQTKWYLVKRLQYCLKQKYNTETLTFDILAHLFLWVFSQHWLILSSITSLGSAFNSVLRVFSKVIWRESLQNILHMLKETLVYADYALLSINSG